MTVARPLLLLAAVGCSAPPPKSAPPSTKVVGHSHDHERGKMLLADFGPYHAAITAHLATAGNELDVFIETAGKVPTPVALRLTRFEAEVYGASDGLAHALRFEPASAHERPPDEPAETCSHFVAKAPWMKADDNLTVTALIDYAGHTRIVTWGRFVPSKYAHHVE